MKKLIWLSVLFMSMAELQAQTADEWLRQKQTQKKYLLQQIAALKVYAGYLGKGIAIARDGLSLIGDIKNGDLSLHKGYFSSLGIVPSGISSFSRVADIISNQTYISRNIKSVKRQLEGTNYLTDEEKRYVKQVCENVLADCRQALDCLADLVTDDRLQMKDDERLEAIENLAVEMAQRKEFSQRFLQSVVLLKLNRSRDENEIRRSKQLNF